MGIQNHHFDLILELTAETLEDHDVDGAHIASISEKLRSYRSAVVVGNDSGE